LLDKREPMKMAGGVEQKSVREQRERERERDHSEGFR
jgi:hypothetical protein